MSRSKLFQQRSVQSPGAGRNPESEGIEHVEDPKRKLNRSLTISGSNHDNELKKFHIKHSLEPTSPLERFSKAKKAISHKFDMLRDHLHESNEFIGQVHQGEESEAGKVIITLIERTKGIADILKRDHMKVVFFGRTSNGKSTVINCLLRERVLPAGIGHTTNCFCSVVGVDEREGYLIHPQSQEILNVKNVRQLAHSLHKEHLDSNILVQIFWPKTKCPMLNGEVELVDSPGIDMNPDLDKWINNYCLDADVFVLVSNAESSLMRAEKSFFHRVSERLSKPNIFILNNRWDCSAQEELDMMEEVKAQHLSANVQFLAHELAVVDEKTAKDRIFFVSAKEVLHVRTQLQPGTVDEEEGRGLADGWKVRLMAFERFEELFKECISSSAIRTKFEQHYIRGSEVIAELEQVLGQEWNELSEKSTLMQKKRAENQVRLESIEKEGVDIHQNCKEKLKETASLVEKKLEVAIEDTQRHLCSMANRFNGEFKESEVKIFQEKLCSFMDGELSQKLVTTSLSVEHNTTKQYLIDKYKVFDLSHYQAYQHIKPPHLSFTFKCSELCKGLTLHTQFNFIRSFGLTNWMKTNIRLEPLMGRMYTSFASLWGVLPTEYAVPMVLLGGAFMLPRVFSWRVWLTSLAGCGTLYAWKWSTFDPEAAVKRQFVDHINSKLEEQKLATCRNHCDQLMNGLHSVLDGLEEELGQEKSNVMKNITKIVEEDRKLNYLQNQARELKNSVHFLIQDFENYKQSHLD